MLYYNILVPSSSWKCTRLIHQQIQHTWINCLTDQTAVKLVSISDLPLLEVDGSQAEADKVRV